MTGQPMVVCEGVGKRFGDLWVLRDVHCEVRRGEVLGIIGPGGHGKSVLLKLMAGLEVPDEGRVTVDGEDLAHMSPGRLAAVRRDMGYLFQNYALFDFMTVAENVAFPLRQQGMAEALVHETVRARLEEVGLAHTAKQLPAELSGGMKKRVALARATAAHARLVLYDDPSAGLDPVTSSKIFRLIGAEHAAHPDTAAVVVSHDMDRLRQVCDRYLMLRDGAVRFSGREADVSGAETDVGTFFLGDDGQGWP